MFRFFPEDNKDDDESESGQIKKAKIELNPSREIIINDTHHNILTHAKKGSALESKLSDGLSLKSVNLADLLAAEGIVKSEKVQGILKSSSDLDSGVYEGGFKTWECTFDLIDYIQENFDLVVKSDCSKPVRVLDLGCGSGLAGLAVLALAEQKNVDIRVDFQDYNEEVIDYVTIPNTLLNFDDERASKCRYFSGDWDSFRELLSKYLCDSDTEGYHVILSSETIYNLEYFPKFLCVLKSCLGKSSGSLYLAAKTFYFGVGGGTKTFLKMVNEDSGLEGSVVHVIKHGVQREIIRVQLKNTPS